MGPDLVDVALDDDAGVEAVAAGRPWSLRAWRLTAVALALVLLVGVGLEGMRGAALARALVPVGLVHDLAVPRHELWRAGALLVLGVVDDVVLVVRPTGGVAGLSVADGSSVWTSDAAGCRLADLGAGVDLLGLGPVPSVRLPADRARLVCSMSDTEHRTTTVLDPVDGRSLMARTASTMTAVTSVGDVLVSIDTGSVVPRTVTAWSLVDGRELWHATVGDAASGALYSASVLPAAVVVETVGGTVALDLHTGAEPAPGALDVTAAEDPVPGGGALVTRWAPGGGGMRTAGLAPDGTERWSTDGVQLRPRVLAPAVGAPVALLDGSTLVGVDPVTGRTRWSSGTALLPLVGADGVLVVLASLPTVSDGPGYRVLALDAATGAELWTYRPGLRLVAHVSPPSDGRRLAYAAQVDGHWQVVVAELGSGARVASYALPMDVPSELVGLPGGLLGQLTGAELVVLGPAGGTR